MARPTTIDINTGSAQNTGLQNWWPLNQASGSNLVDEIGDLDSTIKYGAYPAGSAYTTGFAVDADLSYAFQTAKSGSDRTFAELAGTIYTPTALQPWSISVWARRGAGGWQTSILDLVKDSGYSDYLQCYIDGSNKLECFWNDEGGSYFQVTANDALAASNADIHHYAFTYSGSGAATGLKIYIDGVENSSYTRDSDGVPTTPAFAYGLMLYGGTGLPRLADIRYYNVELSAALVAAMYAEATRWELYTAPPPPDAPVLSATAGVGSVVLDWDAVADADTYSVYRGTVSGSLTLFQSGITDTSLTDTTAIPGVTYLYIVTATNDVGESDDSNEVAAEIPFSAPVLTATASNLSATLSWSAVNSATSYRVYRGTSSGSLTILQAGVALTSFVDAAVTLGTTYYYAVIAENSGGDSAQSNEVSVAIVVPAGGARGISPRRRFRPAVSPPAPPIEDDEDDEELTLLLTAMVIGAMQ